MVGGPLEYGAGGPDICEFAEACLEQRYHFTTDLHHEHDMELGSSFYIPHKAGSPRYLVADIDLLFLDSVCLQE